MIDFLRHQAEFQGFAISALPNEKKQKIEPNRVFTRQSPKLIENQSQVAQRHKARLFMQQSVKRLKQSHLLRAQTPGGQQSSSLTRVYLKTEGSDETDGDFPFSKVADNFKS